MVAELSGSMIKTAAQRIQAARFARELGLVAAAYMAYEIVRSVSAGRTLDAFENAEVVVRIEQALGIFAELNVQVAFLGYSAVVQVLSLWYFWGHFPLIIVFAVWAFYRHRTDYNWARSAFFAAGGIALIVYVTFPVAPPRLLPGAGFVDTLRNVFALQYDDSSLVNQYAAVPSMHQGFALIVGVTLLRIVGGRRGVLLLIAVPAIMFFSVVATGNHWFLDAILGLLAAGFAMFAATQLERHGQRLKALLRCRFPSCSRVSVTRT
ncbi:MAG: phosphatase PAP2 family protein [Dehalococcoidia bacterium]